MEMSITASRADQALQDARDAAARERDFELGEFDVEGFANFLIGECDGCSPIQRREQFADVTEEDFTGEPVSFVLMVACDQGQPMKTRIAALDAVLTARAVDEAKQSAEYLERVQRWTRRAA
jgi:hypothetical protein